MPEETKLESLEEVVATETEEVLAQESAESEPVVETVAPVVPAEKDIVLEDPSSDGYNTPSEVRIKELAPETKTEESSESVSVYKGEELVATFKKTVDGANFKEKAQLFAEAHGYTVA